MGFLSKVICTSLFSFSLLIAQWSTISPVSNEPNLNDVCVFASWGIFAVGDAGYAAIIKPRLTNSTAEVLNLNTGKDLYSVCGYDNKYYWIGGDGILIKSDDSLLTFEQIELPPDLVITKVEFKNENEGFFCAKDGIWGKSVDGGDNWEIDTLVTKGLNDFYLFNGNNIILAGEEGTLLLSTNDGVDWNNIDFPGGDDLTSVYIGTSGKGHVTSKEIYFTTDYGNSWFIPEGAEPAEDIYVSASNREYGRIFVEKSGRYIVEETGANFLVNKIPGEGGANKVKLLSQDWHIVIGDKSNICKIYSSNYAEHYPMGDNINFYKVEILNKDEIILLGTRGFFTSNGGATWNRMRYPSDNIGTEDMDASFLSLSTGYLKLADTLYKTTNSGLSWTYAKQFNSDFTFCFLDDSTGIVATDTFAHKTTNSGLTWETHVYNLPYHGEISPERVKFVNNNTGYIIRAPGGMIQTTNTGDIWFYREVWDTYVTDVAAYNQDTLIAVGYSIDFPVMYSNTGRVFTSHDGGLSWQSAFGFPGRSVSSVYFHNSGSAFLGTGDGRLYKSQNLGKIWHLDNEFMGRSIGDIFTDGEDGLFVIQYGSSKIYYNPSYFSTTTVTKNEIGVEGFRLLQNYPNPFNPATKITFELPVDSNIKLAVYNSLGELVEIIAEGYKKAGAHEYMFNSAGKNLASGIYFYSLFAGDKRFTRGMILVK